MYLSAFQSFTESTDVILLTTNLFKKEFSSATNNQYEIGMAINCLANIATKDLARDCISDLVVLMNHSRAYVRKKAVLAIFKLYVKFPQGLRLTFDKLKDRLDDSESSVISTAVNVICELANKNPRNYLAMAPKFFRLLTTSSNNWMLIKVVKLLGSLVSEEPRLGTIRQRIHLMKPSNSIFWFLAWFYLFKTSWSFLTTSYLITSSLFFFSEEASRAALYYNPKHRSQIIAVWVHSHRYSCSTLHQEGRRLGLEKRTSCGEVVLGLSESESQITLNICFQSMNHTELFVAPFFSQCTVLDKSLRFRVKVTERKSGMD